MEHLTIKHSTFIILLLSLTLILSGCYKDNEEELYPNGDCDTENVSFSNDVWPVINNRCVSCHTGSAASGGMRMGNYSELVTTINSGRFLGAINHQSGFTPMPQDGAKLDACTISKIEAWINDGMPQN
jgi:hypothetical protein